VLAKCGHTSVCYAAYFAECLGVMNAKHRKKEKRRAARGALKTDGFAQHAAPDAELWGEPYVEDPADAGELSPASWTAAEIARCNKVISLERRKELPQVFAAAVSQLLIASELPGVTTEYELDLLTKIVEHKILPPIVQGLHDTREAQRLGWQVEKVDVKVQWELENKQGAGMACSDLPHYEAHTQDLREITQDGLQQESVAPEQHQSNGYAKDNADFANGLTAEEKEVWDSASARTALEGGSTEKLYRAMMKKLKAKVKKQALIAA